MYICVIIERGKAIIKLKIFNMDNSMQLGLKNVLTMDEMVVFTGLSKSTLYKMTSRKEIKHYKPNNKLIYFKRDEVEAWLFSNPINTDEEITQKATDYCYSNKA